MLVPFALDAESVAPDPDWTPAQQQAAHLGLLDTWKRLGLLVHDGERFSHSRVKQAIDALPQKLAPLWQELLERLPLVPGPDVWNGVIGNTPGCLDVVGAAARVAVIDDAKAEVDFGFAEEDLSISLAAHQRLEICRFVAVPHAEAFTDASGLCGQHIHAGVPYADLWNARFGALARAPIKAVVVVDRYSVSQHYECPQHYLSGLERFLRLLDGEASGNRYVTLISAWTAELNQRQPHVTLEMVAEEVRALGARLHRKQIRRVRLVMLPNTVFGDLHHDRFVRFGEYVWDLGIGIKVFEGPGVAETSSASFKTCLLAPTYQAVEVTLQQDARARSIEVNL
jgi:hypothetical protein